MSAELICYTCLYYLYLCTKGDISFFNRMYHYEVTWLFNFFIIIEIHILPLIHSLLIVTRDSKVIAQQSRP